MSALLRYLSPRLFDQLEVGGGETESGLWRATICALVFTGLGCTVAAVFHDQIFSLLAAPEYHAASRFLPWLVLVAGLGAAGELVSMRLFGAMNSAALIRPKIVTALLGTILIFLGAWQFGVSGVVAAQVIHSCLFLIWILSGATQWGLRRA